MDLSKLSKAEKLELLSLLEEKARRKREERPHFNPHAGQRRVIQSTALERYLFCGNAFGKTTLMVNELHWRATGFNPITKQHSPVPAKIALVLDTPEKVNDIITEYRKWAPLREDQLSKGGKAHYSNWKYDNGSTVTVLTHEVTELKNEGSQWTDILFDEPPPRDQFVALARGGRIKGRPMNIFMSGTPIRAAWLRTEVYEPWVRGELPFVECFTGHTEENLANLEEGWLERFTAKLSEKEKRIRLEGQFFDLDGLALSHLFRSETHEVPDGFPWDAENPCVLVIDPHPSKAHNAVLIGADRENRLYVVEEYKEKAVARCFIQNLIACGWFSKYRVVDVVYDSLGSADTTSGEGFRSFGDVINEVLHDEELPRARATTYDEKSDEDFIERIRDVLAVPEKPDSFGRYVPKLRFFKRCKGTIDDIRTVQWFQDRQLKENRPKLDIRQKDFLSCVKYALATKLFYDKPRRSQPHMVKHSLYGVTKPGARAKISLYRR